MLIIEVPYHRMEKFITQPIYRARRTYKFGMITIKNKLYNTENVLS